METVEQFLARGGKISTVNEGERALTAKEMWAKSMGESTSFSYTEHRMREAENMGTLDCQEFRREMR